MTRRNKIICEFFLLGAISVVRSSAAEPAEHSPEALTFFERKVRPVLIENCFECHGAEQQEGRLRLDSLNTILTGGESGPALVPGDPEHSRIIKVLPAHPESQVPPKKRLTQRQIADLTEWVRRGAPWPGDTKAGTRSPQSEFTITAKDRAYWAFQPIERPRVPKVKARKRVTNPIDAFVLVELESKGLTLNPPAAKRELIRRVFFDLIGLPPTPEEIERFVSDTSPHAYEKLIDNLLARPQYGERWGRHWLDVVRFAQTNGYERDGEKPFAWRYRDYVIKAFNEDKPYDQFIREQLAGDELDTVTNDSIIATGFYRLGVWDDEPDDKRMAVFDELDDVMVTTGAAFLGLTLGCARCHTHKFDPIPQADYYRLLSFIRNVRPAENARYALDSPNYSPLADARAVKQWQAEHEAKLKPLEAELPKASGDEAKKKIQKKIDEIKNEKSPFEWALSARESGPKVTPVQVLLRGNAATPGVEVRPAFLSVLDVEEPHLPPPRADAASTGLRRQLADWIARKDNPLTARVMANRIWHYHFGKGIVKTTCDFGKAGTSPTHPRLLDWLAAEFVENSWSVKRLHKTILLSSTYRQSSAATNAKALALDPANDLLWRQNLRRLDAEAIRDSILAVSGTLNLKMGGRGFFPRLSGEVLAGASRPGLDWETSTGDELLRRSVYAFVKRTMAVPAMESFDYNNTAGPLGERPVTTVAPQALTLLNDEFMMQQAAAFAERLVKEVGSHPHRQIVRAYQIALGRKPTPREREIAGQFLLRQNTAFAPVSSRLTFRPDVPISLETAFMSRLPANEFLVGPQDWSYHRGDWSKPYEGIRTVDRIRGPFALGSGTEFVDGTVEAKLTLHRSAEFSSLLLRASATNNVQRGYELALDARQQKVVLRRHGNEVVTLAEALAPIRVAAPHSLKLEVHDAEIRVWLDGGERPLIAATDPTPITQPGAVGIRAWGATVSVDELRVNAAGQTFDLMASHAREGSKLSHQRALESFCLLLLNLNELVYVD